MYPEYQEQVFEEIKSVFLDRDQPITQELLKELTFLDLVIKETLRIFPSVPFLTRLATKDVVLSMETFIVNLIKNVWIIYYYFHR